MITSLAASINCLTGLNRLRVGQRLILSNRHIVLTVLADGLVINVGDRLLYWFQSGDLLGAFPVGVGRVAWETPDAWGVAVDVSKGASHWECGSGRFAALPHPD